MSAELKRNQRGSGHEREIDALTSMTGFPEHEVRSLFEGEFARLASGATVGTFLTVRTVSNVLTILRGRCQPPMR
ncbi:MAG: hypothetical protein WDO68_16865 [Gammaproteobacteria bacterium]